MMLTYLEPLTTSLPFFFYWQDLYHSFPVHDVPLQQDPVTSRHGCHFSIHPPVGTGAGVGRLVGLGVGLGVDCLVGSEVTGLPVGEAVTGAGVGGGVVPLQHTSPGYPLPALKQLS